jgi:Rrf2 family transcriptional regulator, iron-sulfur cluster assembly transcription factor
VTERPSGPVDRWTDDPAGPGNEDTVVLNLGRRADYAIRATLDLAGHVGALRKAREIGDAMGIPASYLPQILAALVRHDIASSLAGPRGGYGLARPASEISLLDVVAAVDGATSGNGCVLRGGECQLDDRCAVHDSWTRAQQALLDHLGSTTFAFLLEEKLRTETSPAGT